LRSLAQGDVDIVVGTHALFSRNVIYKNLRFVVIDEQHRFGVTQREAIMCKGSNPNLLMMSATPIPRTLAFTLFGDMDVSVLKDKPLGRKKIITHLARINNEKKVYDFVREELKAGRQAYFVYPLIEFNEELDLRSAEEAVNHLSKDIFPEYKCALLHSKIDDDEKLKIMEEFRKGDINILAATSVVEVGVDVPNAVCMVVLNAERFGLSALHQLRGRVGRGDAQSYCFLIYSEQNEAQNHFNKIPEMLDEDERTKEGQRLMTMLDNDDGFVIAEKDLKFRGPGLISGTEQSGHFRLGIADPIRYIDILQQAREDALELLEKDPALLSEDARIVSEVLKRAPPFSEIIF